MWYIKVVERLDFLMRKGYRWEYRVKRKLKEGGGVVLKQANSEHVDFLVFRKGEVWLVEAKETKKEYYYPKDEEKKRKQLRKYFETKKRLEELGYKVRVVLMVKVRGKEYVYEVEREEDVPVRIPS